METTIYLIRHAQSHLSRNRHHSLWPLSVRGKEQAAAIAPLLETLNIERLYCSPYLRCIETIKPFLARVRLELLLHEDLHERIITMGLVDNFQEVWEKSWEDFQFAMPGCESSAVAQSRFCTAVRQIAKQNPGSTIGVSSHGNVIALLLHHLDASYSRTHADQIKNPDVLKIVATEQDITWDRDFVLAGLAEISTAAEATPITWDG